MAPTSKEHSKKSCRESEHSNESRQGAVALAGKLSPSGLPTSCAWTDKAFLGSGQLQYPPAQFSATYSITSPRGSQKGAFIHGALTRPEFQESWRGTGTDTEALDTNEEPGLNQDQMGLQPCILVPFFMLFRPKKASISIKVSRITPLIHCFQNSQADWGGEARPSKSRKRPSLQHRPPAAGVGSWIAGGQLVPALLDVSRIGSEARVAHIHGLQEEALEGPGSWRRTECGLSSESSECSREILFPQAAIWVSASLTTSSFTRPSPSLKGVGSFWRWLRLEGCCHTYQISLHVSLPPPLHILKNQGATGTQGLKSQGAQDRGA
ncbi:uncharacterized protein LOC112628336 [Theropithecus gelada]|uniref:uncharacterized protein LOC112628336 n=1 Tax=Theropithecus gelada TaxID=9565 RepID=UPI000DC174F0|nr:uncharacterized protein LOC112628336 [Theropithecus gelada]